MTPVETSHVPCGNCHLCCRSDVIMLLPEHGDVIESYDHEWVTLPEGRGAVVKKGADGNCIYLGPDGCTIHNRAPAICRIFDCRRWLLSKTRNERRASSSPAWLMPTSLKPAASVSTPCQSERSHEQRRTNQQLRDNR